MTETLIVFTAFFGTLLLLVATTVADVRYTSRGISKKLGVEGTSWIVALYGPRPTPFQLYTINTLVALPMVASGVLGIVLDHNYGLLGLSIGPMIGYSLRHIQGARAWAKLGA